MAGKNKAATRKSSRKKPPVGSDGLNKYQRYYRKKKSLAQSKLGKEEMIGSDSDGIRPSTSQGLGEDHDSSTDSIAQPPHQPPRLFCYETQAKPEKTDTNLEDENEPSSVENQPSCNAPCPAPPGDAFFPPAELSVSHDHTNVDWPPSAHALHLPPETLSPHSSFSSAPPETLSPHSSFSSDWRPPTQLIPSAEDPSVMNRSIQDSFRDFALYLEMRDVVATWSRYWTGMDNWPQALNEALERHKGYGPEGVSTFLRKLWLHEQRGRRMLHDIQSRLTGKALPSNPQALMALWNLQQEQVMVLTRGLTIMELTGSLALHHIHSIDSGRVIDAIPSALSAPNTALFPSKHRTEQEEEDIENYLTGSS